MVLWLVKRGYIASTPPCSIQSQSCNQLPQRHPLISLIHDMKRDRKKGILLSNEITSCSSTRVSDESRYFHTGESTWTYGVLGSVCQREAELREETYAFFHISATFLKLSCPVRGVQRRGQHGRTLWSAFLPVFSWSALSLASWTFMYSLLEVSIQRGGARVRAGLAQRGGGW